MTVPSHHFRSYLHASYLPFSGERFYYNSTDFKSSFSKVRVIFWGTYTPETVIIYKGIISSLRQNKVFCFPILFEEEISLFDINNLERFSDFTALNHFNQLHIILPEQFDILYHQKCSLNRLKVIFFLCSLSAKSNVNFIICDHPVFTSDTPYIQLLFQHLNDESERIVSENSSCNVYIFNTQFLNSASRLFVLNRNLTPKGCYVFSKVLRPFLFKVILDIYCRNNRPSKLTYFYSSFPQLNLPKFCVFKDDFQHKVPFFLRWNGRCDFNIPAPNGVKIFSDLTNEPNLVGFYLKANPSTWRTLMMTKH